MVNYGLENDDLMEAMDQEYAFSEASNAFGPTEFANALSQNLNSHGTNAQKVLGHHGLLHRYQRIAQEKVDQFQRTGASHTADWWALETRLWDLIRRLYEFRWTLRNQDNTSDLDSSLEETRIILAWLTDTAPRITETEYIQSNRWFITRENIKMQKLSGRQSTLHDAIVSELDPDATLRQGKGLMNEDAENERKLLKQVFAYLRIGDIALAQQVCRDSNNHWRAASLSGVSGKKETLNNHWRKMCFQLARQAQVDRYERAVYGVVCGDLESVVPVCGTWEDQMWAHFNAIYIWKLEEKLRQAGGQGDVVTANFDGVTADVVLERLINSDHEKISNEAQHPIRCLMGRLITGNIDGAMDYIQSLAASNNNLSQGQLAFLLRLSVHIILVMRDLEIPHDQSAANEILREYIHVLMHYHVDDQIALYAYHLPHEDGIKIYALFLSSTLHSMHKLIKAIDSDQRRIRQLENAQKYNLNTADIVRHTMKITLQKTQSAMEELYAEPGQPVLAVALNDPLTPLDEIQIRAIEWVLISGSDELTFHCLANGNIIFRRFLLAGHLNAVKALAERVPCSHLIRPDEIHSDDGMDNALGQHALEYAQHSALWELFASFDRWEEFASQYMNAHHARRDRLAEKQFKNETKSALGDFVTRGREMVLGEEGLNSALDDIVRTEDPESYATVARIRDLYAPEIVLRMHEIFMWGGEHLDPSYLDDAFDLAAAVADSGAKLYDSFRATNQLEDYLGKVRELAIQSLSPDNLGTGIGTGLTT